LGYIHNLLKMVFLLWFHFVCYCTQTVLLTTVVLSCSGFYWHSVSSTFQPSDSFVCSAHSVCEWYAVNILWFILSSAVSVSQNLLVNSLSLSVINSLIARDC
jgi:hypothetical protein